ncbi:MAG TPA: DNA polymerase III subunit delta [Acidobacteriota bacterium]|jgi:DNA polymerase-3 subunit delta
MIPALRTQKELQREIVPVYLLLGSDAFLKKHVVDTFVRRLDPGVRDFNVARFSEKELHACLDAAQTMPMAAPQRLVILEDLSKIAEEEWEGLYQYVENPSLKTILLLIAARLPEPRVKNLARNAKIISAKEPDFAEARSLIEGSFRKDGYQLAAGVVDELLEQIGNNMQVLSQDIEKIKLFRLEEKTITVEDVVGLSNRVREHEIWDLTNRIASRNRGDLLCLLNKMLESGSPPLLLLKILYSHFVGLLLVKELTEGSIVEPRRNAEVRKSRHGLPAGKTESDIAEAAGMNPYRLRRLLGQASKFQLSELKSALCELHRADSALKSSGLPEKTLLEMALIRIVTVEGSRQ